MTFTQLQTCSFKHTSTKFMSINLGTVQPMFRLLHAADGPVYCAYHWNAYDACYTMVSMTRSDTISGSWQTVYLNFPSQHALARFFSFHTSPVQNADSLIPDSSEIGIERFSYNYRVTMVPETYFRQHGFIIQFQMIWQITQR